MREWLIGLTKPEDGLLWTWACMVAAYAALGIALGLRARRRGRPVAQELATPADSGPSSQ